ncbi:MAG: hypothetical protein ABIT10_01355 [Alteraurantiacibacter sp.]
MSWTSLKLGAASLALAALVAPAAVLAGVVVSSSGPSAGQYPVGRQIGDNDRITLRAGDTVTVLQNGGTRVLRGPGTLVLAQTGAATTNAAFASLTTQRSARRARTGAVRTGATGPVSNPSLWYIDVTKAGTVCLPGTDSVRLWRADTQAESTYAIEPQGAGEAPIPVTFPAGEMLAAWDIYHPPVAHQTYRIGHGSGSSAVDVRFVFLDTVPDTAEALAASLIASGCTTQVEQMALAMEIAE